MPVVDYIQNFDCFEHLGRTADVIRMRMRRDEIVELLNVMTLQRFDNSLPSARVARVDEHRFARR